MATVTKENVALVSAGFAAGACGQAAGAAAAKGLFASGKEITGWTAQEVHGPPMPDSLPDWAPGEIARAVGNAQPDVAGAHGLVFSVAHGELATQGARYSFEYVQNVPWSTIGEECQKCSQIVMVGKSVGYQWYNCHCVPAYADAASGMEGRCADLVSSTPFESHASAGNVSGVLDTYMDWHDGACIHAVERTSELFAGGMAFALIAGISLSTAVQSDSGGSKAKIAVCAFLGASAAFAWNAFGDSGGLLMEMPFPLIPWVLSFNYFNAKKCQEAAGKRHSVYEKIECGEISPEALVGAWKEYHEGSMRNVIARALRRPQDIPETVDTTNLKFLNWFAKRREENGRTAAV